MKKNYEELMTAWASYDDPTTISAEETNWCNVSTMSWNELSRARQVAIFHIEDIPGSFNREVRDIISVNNENQTLTLGEVRRIICESLPI